MITIDKRFDNDTISILKNLIGSTFDNYQCDPFVYSPSVFGIVGFSINKQAYKLTNNTEILDYYGKLEDVAVLKFTSCDPTDIKSQEDDGSLITTPVNSTISTISIVEENQQLFHNKEQTYNIFVPRAIIFHLNGGHEIMFEKDIWFSETITIQKGYHLKDNITPVDEFLESWDDFSEYSPRCIRKEIVIN